VEFDMPAGAAARATPNPYSSPGPAQDVGIIGYRAIEVRAFNPQPEGGLSNPIYQMVQPR
jgi:hypothetical protein